MGYLREVHGTSHDLYRRMHDQVREATLVFAGGTAINPLLFDAMSQGQTTRPPEQDGSEPPLKDMIFAFAAANYRHSCGRVTARQTFPRDVPVGESTKVWNSAITDAFQGAVTPAVNRRLFLDGGIWHVLIDALTDPAEGWRDRLAATTDFSSLRKDRRLAEILASAHPFLRRTPPTEPLSHSGSHLDSLRFANSVLGLGERELGLRTDDDKAQLLANSLPEQRRSALLELEGLNRAVGDFMRVGDGHQYADRFFTIDDHRLHIGLDMGLIQAEIQARLPDVATNPHRGCPVLYQTTEYQGSQTPVFSVMDDTIVRMYQTSGALAHPSLR